MRGTDRRRNILIFKYLDSSPLTRGRHRNNTPSRCTRRFIPSCEGQTHSVFMWLSAALNTSLNNLRIISSTFNMPKNPPHFHFFFKSFFCFSTPITRDIPAPYDLDRPTPFLIRFRNAFASLTRSRNSYSNTLTG